MQKDIEKILWPIDIGDMFGVGKKTTPRLKEIGINTIGDLATSDDIDGLRRVLGKQYFTLVQWANGESDDIDSKDGSGEVSPYMSRMANASLHGAQVGHNKKTIWHFYNEKYGTAGMLKWAEYEVTNAKRRSSYAAPTSYERLYRKIFDLSIVFFKKVLFDI